MSGPVHHAPTPTVVLVTADPERADSLREHPPAELAHTRVLVVAVRDRAIGTAGSRWRSKAMEVGATWAAAARPPMALREALRDTPRRDDVVVALDPPAVAAIWRLRGRSRATLVNGLPAAVRVVRAG